MSTERILIKGRMCGHKLIHSAGMDAGNRSMRRAGRTKWNKEDYNAAARECDRLYDLKFKGRADDE